MTKDKRKGKHTCPEREKDFSMRSERWRAFVQIQITCAIHLKAVAFLSQRRV